MFQAGDHLRHGSEGGNGGGNKRPRIRPLTRVGGVRNPTRKPFER